eukprot:EG_transcript_13369
MGTFIQQRQGTSAAIAIFVICAMGVHMEYTRTSSLAPSARAHGSLPVSSMVALPSKDFSSGHFAASVQGIEVAASAALAQADAASAATLTDSTADHFMSLSAFRFFAIFTTFLIALVGSLLPTKLAGDGASLNTMSRVNMFAGGIFLAGGYVHLLPTAAENQALQAWAGSDGLLARVPWAHLFCCSGFLAVLLVEQAAKRLKSLNGGVLSTFDSDDEEHAGGGHRDTPSEESRGPCDGPRPPSGAASSMALPLVLAAALTFHSLLEGLGIGASGVASWGIYGAVMAHKGLAAFSLASRFASAGYSKKQMIPILTAFSSMTPLGIALGCLASWNPEGGPSAAAGFCTALSAGTFIYVASAEVIPRELASPGDKAAKLVALLAGFVCFAALAPWC